MNRSIVNSQVYKQRNVISSYIKWIIALFFLLRYSLLIMLKAISDLFYCNMQADSMPILIYDKYHYHSKNQQLNNPLNNLNLKNLDHVYS